MTRRDRRGLGGGRIRRRRWGRLLVGLCSLTAVVLGATAGVRALTLPVAPGARATVLVNIRPGTRLRGIAVQLRQAGVIRSAWAFEALAIDRGVARRLQAGEYSLSPAMTPTTVLAHIAGGWVAARSLVVPEGWNAAQIVAGLDRLGVGGGQAALRQAAQDPALLVDAALPAPAAGAKVALEGYLFPATYTLAANATPQQIFLRMLSRFNRAWTPALALAARRNAGLNTAQAVTLASIVQREVRTPAQMALVAGIYLHRLRLGMALDADPTVLYALGLVAQNAPLSEAQTATPSPYNTYRYPGLPPGPICNPGEVALEAVAHPAATQALYFLTTPGGRLVTANTLGQQEADQARYGAPAGG